MEIEFKKIEVKSVQLARYGFCYVQVTNNIKMVSPSLYDNLEKCAVAAAGYGTQIKDIEYFEISFE